MNPNKNLIGGIERLEEKIYPPDWLCARCSHILDVHIHIFVDFPNTTESILECQECSKVYFKGMKFCYAYEPIDNLSYVEYLAKNKEVLK